MQIQQLFSADASMFWKFRKNVFILTVKTWKNTLKSCILKQKKLGRILPACSAQKAHFRLKMITWPDFCHSLLNISLEASIRRVFFILCEIITNFCTWNSSTVYTISGASPWIIALANYNPSISLCGSRKVFPSSSQPRFGIKWIVFCTKSFIKVLYVTKTGSWRTLYGLPFFSPWDTLLLFTRLEVSKGCFKEYFQ